MQHGLNMTHHCSSEERETERLLLYVPLHLCSLAGIGDSSNILHNIFTSLRFASSTLPCKKKQTMTNTYIQYGSMYDLINLSN